MIDKLILLIRDALVALPPGFEIREARETKGNNDFKPVGINPSICPRKAIKGLTNMVWGSYLAPRIRIAKAEYE